MSKMDKTTKMTRKQQEIYDYIAEYIAQHSYPPSVREICDGVGLRSPSTVHFHLQNMEEKGFLAKDGKARALTLAQTGDAPAAAAAVERAPVYEEPEIPAGRVPILGTVAAGTPILAQECIEDYLTFDTNGRDGEYFALRVRGESMLNAGILPGDLVVVHQQREAHNGEIVVALIEDEATVKRLQRRNGEVWLLPENDAYEPIDGRYASILGKVSAVVRTY
jgi:repressor LexA